MARRSWRQAGPAAVQPSLLACGVRRGAAAAPGACFLPPPCGGASQRVQHAGRTFGLWARNLHLKRGHLMLPSEPSQLSVVGRAIIQLHISRRLVAELDIRKLSCPRHCAAHAVGPVCGEDSWQDGTDSGRLAVAAAAGGGGWRRRQGRESGSALILGFPTTFCASCSALQFRWRPALNKHTRACKTAGTQARRQQRSKVLGRARSQ